MSVDDTRKLAASAPSPPQEDVTSATADAPATRREGPERRRRPTLSPGDTIGKYLILGHLGKGGMGSVFRAHDGELNRDVALKLLSGRRDPVAVVRLQREAQALAKLSHPNVIAVYEVATAPDVVYLSTELVEGVSLSRWLRSQRRRRAEILDVFSQAARGLAAAHRVGLVHRDFKPSNVMVGSDGRVRVVDFGLARTQGHSPDALTISSGSGATPSTDAYTTDDPSGPAETSQGTSASLLDSPLTRVDVVVGTPAYMAPEQHERGFCDARSDQFSFCVSLFGALFGARPFVGADYEQLKSNVLAGRISPPPADADVPRWLRRIIERGLEPDPAKRWPSMEALVAALADDPMIRWRRRVGALLVVGAVALGAFGLWRGTRAPTTLGPRCDDGQARLEGLWGPSRRAALERALAQTGHRRAKTTFATLAEVYDQRVASWSAMVREACEETHVRGTQSQALLDLRMRCLEQHRRDLAAELDLVLKANQALVQRLADAPPEPWRLDDCADVATLQAAVPLPTDPALRARIEALGERLAAGRALASAGAYAEARAVLAEIAESPEARAYRPLQAEALLDRSGAEDSSGAYEASRQSADDGALAALAGRRDDLAVAAWSQLVWYYGVRKRQPDNAHVWARYAEAALERAITVPAKIKADLRRSQAQTLALEHRYDDARTKTLEALAIWEKIDAADRAVAKFLSDLGEFDRMQGRNASAIVWYRKALAAATQALGANHPDIATMHINISYSLAGVGAYGEAVAEARRGLAVVEATLGPDVPRVAEALTALALAEIALGHGDEAVAALDRALVIDEADGTGPFVPADLVNRSLAHLSAGRLDAAAADADAALARALKIDDAAFATHARAAKVEVLVKQRRFAEADALADKSLPELVADLGAGNPELVSALVALGDAKLGLGRPREALFLMLRALALCVATPEAHALIAPAQIGLARALVATSGAAATPAAKALALSAIEHFRALGPGRAAEADASERWLREQDQNFAPPKRPR
jgi:tRNA A-37 threonylcarbamoyl transferase component Bud32